MKNKTWINCIDAECVLNLNEHKIGNGKHTEKISNLATLILLLEKH